MASEKIRETLNLMSPLPAATVSDGALDKNDEKDGGGSCQPTEKDQTDRERKGRGI